MALITRLATPQDAEALLAIFRPYVEETHVSFETVTPTAAAFREKIEKVLSAWTWLVLEDGGRCAGYAYGASHRPAPGYQLSAIS